MDYGKLLVLVDVAYIVFLIYLTCSKFDWSSINAKWNKNHLIFIICIFTLILIIAYIIYLFYTTKVSNKIDADSESQSTKKEPLDDKITEKISVQKEADVEPNKDNVIKLLEDTIADKNRIITLLNKSANIEAKS